MDECRLLGLFLFSEIIMRKRIIFCELSAEGERMHRKWTHCYLMTIELSKLFPLCTEDQVFPFIS